MKKYFSDCEEAFPSGQIFRIRNGRADRKNKLPFCRRASSRRPRPGEGRRAPRGNDHRLGSCTGPCREGCGLSHGKQVTRCVSPPRLRQTVYVPGSQAIDPIPRAEYPGTGRELCRALSLAELDPLVWRPPHHPRKRGQRAIDARTAKCSDCNRADLDIAGMSTNRVRRRERGEFRDVHPLPRDREQRRGYAHRVLSATQRALLWSS